MLFSRAVTALVSFIVASATLVSGASIMRPDGDNGSCAQLQRICVGQVHYDLQDVWAVESCLLAGVCYERQGATLDDFVGALWKAVGHSGAPPKSADLPTVSPSVSDTLSSSSYKYSIGRTMLTITTY